MRFARRKFDLRLAFFGSMGLLHFPVQGMTAEKWIILLLLQAARRIQALFVACADVAGDRFTLGLGFCALENDNVPGHES